MKIIGIYIGASKPKSCVDLKFDVIPHFLSVEIWIIKNIKETSYPFKEYNTIMKVYPTLTMGED